MSAPRTIKKYPNRRLYDTAISKYITLEDVRRLVLEEQPFCVVDAKTQEDISRSILLQIILEREQDGSPIFSQQMLSQMIRFYGDSMQGMLASYLEGSMKMFEEHQGRLRDHVNGSMTDATTSVMRELTEKNLGLWQDVQRGFVNATMSAVGGGINSHGAEPREEPDE